MDARRMVGGPTGGQRPAAATVPDDAAILEFTRVGAIVRVAALDPATLAEVVIQGPAAAALRKLAYVLDRRRRAAAQRG